jgi:hypothetical protein
MTLPNPDTSNSGVCDVVAFLANEDRESVLLHAMELLPVDTQYVTHTLARRVIHQHCGSSSRELIETTVEALFLAPVELRNSDNIVRARLLRAKSRIQRGLHAAAHESLVPL